MSRLIATTVARAVLGKLGGSRPLQLGRGKNLVAFSGSLCSFKKNLGKKAEERGHCGDVDRGFCRVKVHVNKVEPAARLANVRTSDVPEVRLWETCPAVSVSKPIHNPIKK
jgi:hypothetical protein